MLFKGRKKDIIHNTSTRMNFKCEVGISKVMYEKCMVYYTNRSDYTLFRLSQWDYKDTQFFEKRLSLSQLS